MPWSSPTFKEAFCANACFVLATSLVWPRGLLRYGGWLVPPLVWSQGLICPANNFCQWYRFHPNVFNNGSAVDVEDFDTIPALRQGVEAKAEAGRRPLLLHVGPNVLKEEEVRWYKQVSPFVRGEPYQLAFVEPQASIIPDLRREVDRAWFALMGADKDEEAPRILEAAVCPGVGEATSADGRGSVTMYRFSSRLGADFPGSSSTCVANITSIIFSTRKEWLIYNARTYCWALDLRLFNTSAALSMTGLWALPFNDWEAYLEPVTIPCLTPAGLLGELRSRPEDVVYLVTDTEGSDEGIVASFLDLEGFQPSVLMYEKSCMYLDCMELMQRLAFRGYNVYQQRGDFVAVLDAHARYEE